MGISFCIVSLLTHKCTCHMGLLLQANKICWDLTVQCGNGACYVLPQHSEYPFMCRGT